MLLFQRNARFIAIRAFASPLRKQVFPHLKPVKRATLVFYGLNFWSLQLFCVEPNKLLRKLGYWSELFQSPHPSHAGFHAMLQAWRKAAFFSASIIESPDTETQIACPATMTKH